jgi:hypothetical protein
MTYAGQQKIAPNAHSESCAYARRTTKRCVAGKQRARSRQRKNDKHWITKKQMRERKNVRWINSNRARKGIASHSTRTAHDGETGPVQSETTAEATTLLRENIEGRSL